MTDLIILEKPIRQQNGLYCLNDLHKASGSANKNRPSLWLENQQTIDFIKYISKAENPALEQNQQVIHIVHGGHFRGTYGNRKVALAYATWISPEFFSLVLDVFDGVVSGSLKVAAPQDLPPQSLDEARHLAWQLACAKHDLEQRLVRCEPWLRYWCEVDLSLRPNH